MRRIVTGLCMSLDGVVEADDDWQFAYLDEELLQGIFAGFSRADAVLLGRRSYQGFDALRSEHPDSPVVAFPDATPKYVVSTTLDTLDWHDATLISDDVAEEASCSPISADEVEPEDCGKSGRWLVVLCQPL